MQVSIQGYIVGPIYWPAGQECFKTLNYNVVAQNRSWGEPGSLREHVVRALNDGDFQSCSIAQGRLVVTTTRRDKAGATIRRTREWPLSRFPSIADCLHPEGDDWYPLADVDDFAD